ncbi:MAG TPA: hypothetical protein DER68_06565 [Ruminococcaceae bacterium]|nr:hypothetical protein [Oscillospiraceae bacterium]
MAAVKIIVDYTPSEAASEVYSKAKEFAAKMKTALGSAEFYVVINGGYSDAVISDARKAFSEDEIKVFGQ